MKNIGLVELCTFSSHSSFLTSDLPCMEVQPPLCGLRLFSEVLDNHQSFVDSLETWTFHVL